MSLGSAGEVGGRRTWEPVARRRLAEPRARAAGDRGPALGRAVGLQTARAAGASSGGAGV